MNRRRFALALACATTPLSRGASASDDQPILRVTRPDGQTVALSLADLDAMPQREIRTATPWTEGAAAWSGPELLDVLRAHGLDRGDGAVATALNDYTVRIPLADIAPHRPILATRADGVTLSRREKGPVFVIFAFDGMDDPTLKIMANYAVWQLATLAPAP